jgi:hypothetical protein
MWALGSVLAAALAFTGRATGAENLLPNADFEADGDLNGDPDGWNRAVGGNEAYDQAVVVFGWDAEVKESGQHAVRIARQAGEKRDAKWFRTVPVEENVDYRLAVSYRTSEDFAGPAGVMVHGCGLNELTESLPPVAPGSAGVWQRLELSFTPKQTGQLYIVLRHLGTGTLWYDNASLETVPQQQMVNLVRNAGSERIAPSGLPGDGWWVYPAKLDPQVARIFVDTTVAHSGAASVKMELKALGAADLVAPAARVNPGDTLYFSVYYRSQLQPLIPDEAALAGEAAGMHRNINPPWSKTGLSYRNDVGHSYKPYDVLAKPVTEGWELLEGTTVVPVGAVMVETQFYVGNYVGEVWWDDVVVRKVNPVSLNAAPYEEKISPGRQRLAFVLENYSGTKEPLTLEIFFKDQLVGSATLTPSGNPRENLVADYEIKAAGIGPLRIALSDPQKHIVLFEVEKRLTVAEPLTTSIVIPRFVWPDKKIEKVTETIDVALSPEQTDGAKLVVTTLRQEQQLRREEITPLQPRNAYALAVAGLAPGTYRLRISLVGKDNAEIAQQEEPFEIMGTSRPTVEIRNGALLVQGKPFFPIGMFSPSPSHYKEYAAAGFNFAHNYGFDGNDEGESLDSDRTCLGTLDRAHEAGLWFVVSSPVYALIHEDWDLLRSRFSAFKDHPAVLCYEEEEQIIRMAHSMEGMKTWRALLRELDPDRPVLLGDVARPGPDGKRLFPFEVGDMGVMWWYPFPLAPGRTEIVIPEWLADNLAATDKPVWVAPQSWKNGQIPDGRFPLAEEYRVQAYLSVIHGAKGLMYFGGHIFKDTKEGRWEDLKKVVSELRDLSPVFLDVTAKESVAAQGAEKVSMLFKEHEGKSYLLAANRDAPTAKVTFTLPFKPARISVRFEDREIAADGNAFADVFEKYAVHVYEVSR